MPCGPSSHYGDDCSKCGEHWMFCDCVGSFESRDQKLESLSQPTWKQRDQLEKKRLTLTPMNGVNVVQSVRSARLNRDRKGAELHKDE